MVLRSSEMRTRVEIQRLKQPPSEPNEYGETLGPWETIAERWASVKPLSSREIWQAQQVRPDITHRIMMRREKNLTITSKMRFREVGTGRIWNLMPPRDVGERHRHLEFLAIAEEPSAAVPE